MVFKAAVRERYLGKKPLGGEKMEGEKVIDDYVVKHSNPQAALSSLSIGFVSLFYLTWNADTVTFPGHSHPQFNIFIILFLGSLIAHHGFRAFYVRSPATERAFFFILGAYAAFAVASSVQALVSLLKRGTL